MREIHSGLDGVPALHARDVVRVLPVVRDAVLRVARVADRRQVANRDGLPEVLRKMEGAPRVGDARLVDGRGTERPGIVEGGGLVALILADPVDRDGRGRPGIVLVLDDVPRGQRV